MALKRLRRLAQLPKPPKHGYTVLLVTLLLLMVMGPVGRQLGLGDFTNTILVSMVLLSGLYAVSRRKGMIPVVTLVGLAAFMVHWLIFVTSWDQLALFGAEITGVLFFGLIGFMLLQDILSRKGNISWSLINGALSVYLLMGIVFAFVYSFLYTLTPDAFTGADKIDGPGFHNFTYFSYVTLTTLGFGDITPTRPIASSLVTLEAVVGQIYLTVLVARLVGMHITAEVAELDDPDE
jgi:hypothetical protein